ncbi:hypothetical protein R2083_08250 [Nitrosomonas sp. Is35]|uniref:hypothetical protein n=1 Tax=Nitrosomonas sp. Is35 TaxID=3080534 RepID=UPI00294B8073|nr:hypothetical protein [Nitrosomonas sp. Is35]MDV6347504.1 hypothetical protein [Nitrosomonas sp. Is35]
MNQQQIEKYVSDYLTGATEQFLHEIVNHGIHNTGADIVSVETDDEYNLLSDEFKKQAESRLNG